MDHLIFARWFGIVTVILSLGILFNLEDARKMAVDMVQSGTGYIMGGVLPVIFGTLALMNADSFRPNWHLVTTLVGAFMLVVGAYRIIFVNSWKALMTRHYQKIPFLFSLFGLMMGVVLLYVGFVADIVKAPMS